MVAISIWHSNQTHLNQLINVFRITRKLQTEEFIRDRVGAKLCRTVAFQDQVWTPLI